MNQQDRNYVIGLWAFLGVLVYMFGGFFAWSAVWAHMLGHNDGGAAGMAGIGTHVIVSAVLFTIALAVCSKKGTEGN